MQNNPNSILGTGASSAYFPPRKIESVVIKNNTQLEVVYRTASNVIYAGNPTKPYPDTFEKEIWEVRSNNLVLVKSVVGTHVPAHSVPESVTFPE